MNENRQALRDIGRKLESFASRISGKQLPQSTLFWVLATVLPLVAIVSTHLWLRTAYTGGVFHLEGFLVQYDFGIYRYRLLGRDAVLFVYQHLLRLFHDQPIAMPRDRNATLLFYASFVVVNAVCFAVSNFLLLLLLSDQKHRLSDLHLATYFYLTLIQTFAMAVVNPYDQLAYLLVLISFIAVTIPREWIAYSVLGLAAIAGSLTRETQFLVTPALFSVALFSTGKRSKRFWTAGLFNLVLFSLVYVALRVLITGPRVVSGAWTYGAEWAFGSALILAFLFYINTSVALRIYPDVRPAATLLIFSAPYILTILISGVLRELRLLVPILLAQTFVYIQLAVDSGLLEKSRRMLDMPLGPDGSTPYCLTEERTEVATSQQPQVRCTS